MEVGDAAAWFAVAVALIAAIIALGNANSAKTQAGAALKQAGEAEKTREAAEKQVAEAQKAAQAAEAQVVEARRAAEAAEAQVKLMAEQHEAELAARDENDGPQFELTPHRRTGRTHPITVQMVSGPEAVQVQAVWIGESSAPALDGEAVGGVQADHVGPHRMVRGSKFPLDVHVPSREATITVDVRLHCVEQGGRAREWTRSYSVELEAPPRIQGHVW